MAALPQRINNIRLTFDRPTATDLDLRDGFNPATEAIVLEAYVETSGSGGNPQPSGAGAIGQASMGGWWNRWAIVPSGASWLDLGASWTWNTTGLRPDGLERGATLEAFYGDLTALPALGQGDRGWLTITNLQSTGGIEAILRSKGLDRFDGTFASGR